MKKLVYGLLILLAVLHQDFWWWDTFEPLVFGFVPVGLAYHALLSLLAGGIWALVVHFAWPKELDEGPRESSESGGDAP